MKSKLEKQGKTLLASLSSVIVLALISSAVQAQEVPRRPAKNARLLTGVDRRIGVDAKRHAADVVVRPHEIVGVSGCCALHRVPPSLGRKNNPSEGSWERGGGG